MKINNISFESVEEFKHQGMLAVIQCRIFCLPVCYPKI